MFDQTMGRQPYFLQKDVISAAEPIIVQQPSSMRDTIIPTAPTIDQQPPPDYDNAMSTASTMGLKEEEPSSGATRL